MRLRIADLGLSVGTMRSGPRGAITDVPGVRVGHCTLDAPDRGVHTGVTAVVPAPGSLFREKLAAGVAVFNGFGKSMGLIQLQEKGTLETPIVLTGVSSAGALYDALFRRAMEEHPEICATDGSVNPVVCECNDSFLNDARQARLSREHLDAAIDSAAADFAEGAVGAGRGMSCFHLKGGIGSASRLVALSGRDFVVGALVNANFGRMEDLILSGRRVGPQLRALTEAAPDRESGSVIIVLATDAPLDSRQLARLARRSFIGIGRTGSSVGDGSGDIALAVSTSERIPHKAPPEGTVALRVLHEDHIDPFFKAAVEATEESVLNALAAAEDLRGRDGHLRLGLAGLLPGLEGV
ncbi:MAG: P1 family peptidase [Fretibacterium sp.]|nr:P1 family peptidase [Fretibacterium sp.]